MGSGKSTPIPPSPELQKPWRPVIDWSKKNEILQEVKEFKPSTETLRIVLYGPVGAGKSSFVTSVQRVLLGRNAICATENSTLTGTSFTKKLKIHKMKKSRGEYYPFEIVDIMGIEPNDGGIKTEDVISGFKGHILDEYQFNPLHEITDDNSKYKKKPTLCDVAHCLVCILSADSVSRIDERIFDKSKKIRVCATEMDFVEIPQVIVVTNVDKACELVKEDLKKIYYSKKIKMKMDMCSVNIGIPLNAIYPVKNYAEEITQDADTDMLILTALRDILNNANDYVESVLETKK